MIKPCVRLNGEIINIGPWDELIRRVEVSPAQYDEEGNETTPAAYEDIATNPLPDGAEIVELDVYQDADGAWRPVGTSAPPSMADKMDLMQAALDDLILGGAL